MFKELGIRRKRSSVGKDFQDSGNDNRYRLYFFVIPEPDSYVVGNWVDVPQSVVRMPRARNSDIRRLTAPRDKLQKRPVLVDLVPQLPRQVIRVLTQIGGPRRRRRQRILTPPTP